MAVPSPTAAPPLVLYGLGRMLAEDGRLDLGVGGLHRLLALRHYCARAFFPVRTALVQVVQHAVLVVVLGGVVCRGRWFLGSPRRSGLRVQFHGFIFVVVGTGGRRRLDRWTTLERVGVTGGCGVEVVDEPPLTGLFFEGLFH